MRAGGSLLEIRDVLQIFRVEDEHRDSARSSFVAQEFVHDVRILVAKKDSQLHAGSLGEAGNCRQLAVNIAAPRFRYRENLARSARRLCGVSEERQIRFCEHRRVIVVLKLVTIDGRFGQEPGPGKTLLESGGGDDCSRGWHEVL